MRQNARANHDVCAKQGAALRLQGYRAKTRALGAAQARWGLNAVSVVRTLEREGCFGRPDILCTAKTLLRALRVLPCCLLKIAVRRNYRPSRPALAQCLFALSASKGALTRCSWSGASLNLGALERPHRSVIWS